MSRLLCSCICAICCAQCSFNIPIGVNTLYYRQASHQRSPHCYVLETNIYALVSAAGVCPRSITAFSDLGSTTASVRYFRTCIRINNHFVVRHLIKHECFAPILTLATEEAGRDNLVSAACQEFFENIRKVSFPRSPYFLPLLIRRFRLLIRTISDYP